MSAWPGKFVIGLTGNIATGKSVVRKMLEHLGAYGIDADALAHRAMARGAPGHKLIVDAFGDWILAEDGQIERGRLAGIVFADPKALARLESIIHPLVRQAINILTKRAEQKVIVIEAIKLLESGLSGLCDSVWVTYAPEDVQIGRMMQKRGMNLKAARQRILAQSPQEEKIGAADVVIRNDKTFSDTWEQVLTTWNKVFSAQEQIAKPVSSSGMWVVTRAKPGEAELIADLINRCSGGKVARTQQDIMSMFGEKAFLLLNNGNATVGIIGWQVENLVARLNDLYFDPTFVTDEGIANLISSVEKASSELQCEASLLFLPPDKSLNPDLWKKLGYKESSIQSLGVRAWQEAAIESLPPGMIMWFKKLRDDLVLKPV